LISTRISLVVRLRRGGYGALGLCIEIGIWWWGSKGRRKKWSISPLLLCWVAIYVWEAFLGVFPNFCYFSRASCFSFWSFTHHTGHVSILICFWGYGTWNLWFSL